MVPYLQALVLCVFVSKARLHATFHVTRGLQDKFKNPQCDDDSRCLTNCAPYFARCETSACRFCVCDKNWPTYLASEKKCVQNDDIFSPSAPKYSSFAISSPAAIFFIKSGTSSELLDHANKYTGDLNELWLYITSSQLMNLRTLQCLDFKSSFKVTLLPCTITSSLHQTWNCSRTGDGLYSFDGKNQAYLEFSGLEFYTSSTQLFKWVAYKGTSVRSRSICEVPDTYRGCYRFQDGSTVIRVPKAQSNDCKGKSQSICFEKMNISAPIFSNGNSSCSLLWDESKFSVNDVSWTPVTGYPNNFYLAGNAGQSREIELQMHEQAKILWAGALLKLEIQCQESGSKYQEQHCVLLKFDGELNQEIKIPVSGKSKSSKTNSDSYKASTIGLSVILGAVLLVMVVAAIIMYRRRWKEPWVKRNDDDDDISAKPFCDTNAELL